MVLKTKPIDEVTIMESIEAHIKKDKEILEDPTTNPQMRRHTEEELHDLIEYEEHHHDEIVAGDHHDPNAIELFCDQHPDELSLIHI